MQTGDSGWASRRTALTLVLAALLLTLFVIDCLRSKNPFVDPALFRIRAFAGATLIMAPYSVAFGAMLLSLALWMQTGWGWSPLKTGIAIAPGPFLVPVTSLLIAGRLIARFGGATVIALGIVLFATGMAWWAMVPGLEPSMTEAVIGMVFLGVAVGLTFPTLMGAGTAALPPSSFATGSGVLNMTRQTALALGVAAFVAILGMPQSPLERLAAYQRTWWVMAALTLVCLAPIVLLRKPRLAAVTA
jgi:MFS family permease